MRVCGVTLVTALALLALVAAASAQKTAAKAPRASAAPVAAAPSPATRTTPAVPIADFINVLSDNPVVAEEALDDIGDRWDNSHTVLLLELAQFVERPSTRAHLYDVIRFHTGQVFGPGMSGPDTARGFEWVWQQHFGTPANYTEFKSELYGAEDPDFRPFFSGGQP